MVVHRRSRSRVAADDERLALAACIASVGAAAIHFGTAPAHLDEFGPAGVFMVVVGAAQLVWALALARRVTSRILALGIAANLSLIGLWAVTRTIGLPFGPMAWVAEDVHPNDALAALLELVVVFAALSLCDLTLPRPGRRLLTIATVGAALSVAAASHDPTRERLISATALLLSSVLFGLAEALSEAGSQATGSRTIWRFHVQSAHPRRRFAELGARRRAPFGARG